MVGFFNVNVNIGNILSFEKCNSVCKVYFRMNLIQVFANTCMRLYLYKNQEGVKSIQFSSESFIFGRCCLLRVGTNHLHYISRPFLFLFLF